MQHKAAGTGTGVNCRQDKQGFKQNGEVIPERHGVFTRQHVVQDLRDTHRQCRCTAGTGQDGGFTDVLGQRGQRLRGNGKAPVGDVLRNGNHVTADNRCRAVHGEVHTRLDHRSSNHRHNGHEGLHQHAAVTDITGVAFVIQQFWRSTRRNQRMEARYRTAGNGDEQEREQAAFPDRAGAVGELGQRGHFQLGHGDQDADGQRNDSADLEEGRQIVTRCQYQPYRQNRRNKAVANEHPGDLRTGKGEHRRPLGARRNLAPQPDGAK